MKKICFITTISLTLKVFVIETAKYLHEYGEFDISFICNPDNDFKESLPEYIHFFPVSMERGISISGIKAMLEIKKICKEQKFDLIQYSTPNASCYASIAGAWAGIPVRLYCQWGIAYVGFTGLKRTLFKIIEKMVCSLSTWIEPDSFGNLQFSHREGLYSDKKSSVVWNGSASGVNLKKFDISYKEEWSKEIRTKYRIPQDAVVFIFVGRITRDKGINELLAASKQLITENENVYLLMVGPNDGIESLNHELYAWSKNEDKVIYCGFTNEVEKYMAASDIYVLPSYREGFGSVVVEAQAMGLPVIVTDIPGPTDAMLPEKTGIVVEQKDATSLFCAMRRLYNDLECRESFAYNGVSFVSDSFEQQKLLKCILFDRKQLLHIV